MDNAVEEPDAYVRPSDADTATYRELSIYRQLRQLRTEEEIARARWRAMCRRKWNDDCRPKINCTRSYHSRRQIEDYHGRQNSGEEMAVDNV